MKGYPGTGARTRRGRGGAGQALRSSRWVDGRLLLPVLLVALVLITTLYGTSTTQAAWGNGYTYRRTITIDYTKVGGGADLADFPALVSGTYAYLATVANGGKGTTASGHEIIFTSGAAGASQSWPPRG